MNTEEKITQARQATEAAKAQLLGTFEHVPEDRLHWSPSPTARTALQIVAHCGAANRAFAAVLRGEELPRPASAEEAAAQIRAGGRDVTTRTAAVKLVEDSTAEVIRALEKVSPELIQTAPMSPFGAFPFPFWMHLPSEHMGGHARQIDYLQTIWGDHEDHA
jgi:hypothetical protein